MKKILIFTRYFLPGYKAGGPIRSVANIVHNLSNEFEFFIVTSDRDAFDEAPFPDIVRDKWSKYDRYNVHYTSDKKRSLQYFRKLIRDTPHDILYLNSFFDKTYSLYPLLISKTNGSAPIVLAPRGEFSEGALSIKGLKKSIFIGTSIVLKVHNGIIWQASSEYEVQDISRLFGRNKPKIKIAPNIPETFLEFASTSLREGSDSLKVIYLSRVSPKKNLAFALMALRELKISLEFNIYGLIDDADYWKYCEEISREMPKNIVVTYHGPIAHNKVKDALLRHDLFFLPTKGENYGHVIAEALSVGTPVLISNTTPWRNLVSENVGWDFPLESTKPYTDIIIEYYNRIQENLQFSRKAIQAWYLNHLEIDEIIQSNRQLFLNL